jgi:hypothetical protein
MLSLSPSIGYDGDRNTERRLYPAARVALMSALTAASTAAGLKPAAATMGS